MKAPIIGGARLDSLKNKYAPRNAPTSRQTTRK